MPTTVTINSAISVDPGINLLGPFTADDSGVDVVHVRRTV